MGRAAHVLGVHANTVRTWTDQGILPCLRINQRGDRRYRAEDLRRFLETARKPTATPEAGDSQKSAGTRRRSTVDETAAAAPVDGEVESLRRDVRDAQARLAYGDERQRRLESLINATNEMGAQLDAPRVIGQLLDRAVDLMGAQHAAVYSRNSDGSLKTQMTRNLSDDFIEIVEHAHTLPMTARAYEERRIISVKNVTDDPRLYEFRTEYLRLGVNTVTVAPLISDGDTIGVLALHHDEPFDLDREQSWLLEALATQAASMLRNAQNYTQMARWAAQLQSIQQLGSRLTRLRTVREIGMAICAELNQLLDFHNVRVYCVVGDDCVPVAWRGQVGEYLDEDGDQLRIRVGEGITGWVARYGLAQNLGDAANDRRAQTIPGTDDDLDESLLLAPMLFEDAVIGVIVLAKLGLNQFTSDDLRLLEIYASIAAQAMANADASERLHAQSEALARQLNSQRELLRVTESILSTLDTRALLQEIAERLNALLQVDNMCVDVHDARAGLLRPIFAHGVHHTQYLAATIRDDEGVGGYVLRTGEAQLVQDQLTDERVVHFSEIGPEAGAMIVAPLRGAEGVRGVLTIERLGAEARFADEEFELVKLFAAHVSIALQNAEAHRAVELRAETDALTGLWNHGALIDQIDQLAKQRGKFAMLMVDLDFFKAYNDSLGHQAGNAMLQEISQLLRMSCRETDSVYRFGGDEFALILPNTSLPGARIVAEKVQAAVRSVNEGRPLSTTFDCSIGIAVFPKDGADRASIILAADRGCYAAKRAGRGRISTAAEGLALASEFEPTEPTQFIPSETGSRRERVEERKPSYSAV